MAPDLLFRLFSMAATVAFAVTTVLTLREERHIDVVAASLLAIISAIGGGTIRDVVAGVPVFWATETYYIWTAAIAAVFTFYGRRLTKEGKLYSLMLYLDGLGTAIFGILATDKVWHLGFGLPVGPVMLGYVTSIGGGLLRDILAGEKTLLMSQELYSLPVLLGIIAYVLVLSYLPGASETGMTICILGAFVFRAAAIHWNLKMPDFTVSK